MGQQQLLLIVLGTIVVVIAVAIGINLFSASAPDVNRDLVISVLTSLSSDLHAYYNKQTQYGGGGGSYKGWKVPKSFKKHPNGKKYIKAKVKKNKVKLTGYGTEEGRNGKDPVKVESTVRPSGIEIQIKN